ncbi:MAG: C40 family peptidase [Christensenellaceae bacterium]|nr:C40 family peptidase [Christensenellaceae bacterium]
MKKCILFLLIILLNISPADAALQSCDLLEAALSMLPANHEIIKLYNNKAEALLMAKYDGGVPYYFAGVNENILLKPRIPQQESAYYKPDKMYLYGFDCKGYTRWCYEEQGLKEHPSLDAIAADKQNHLNIDNIPANEKHKYLNVGDLLVGRRPQRHVLMYIGTLRDYGLDESNFDFAPYLDNPLVIHSGNNPFYYDYYKNYIKSMGLRSTPPRGGVTVSLLYIDPKLAPYHRKDVWNKDYAYFLLNDTVISVYDVNQKEEFHWWRNNEKIEYTYY